jgi:hypothetical protein
MLLRFKAWLIRRRFERLFVRPFQPRIEAARATHRPGARKARDEQRQFLHQALRGQG